MSSQYERRYKYIVIGRDEGKIIPMRYVAEISLLRPGSGFLFCETDRTGLRLIVRKNGPSDEREFVEFQVKVMRVYPPHDPHPGDVDIYKTYNSHLDGMCTGFLPPEYSSPTTFRNRKVTVPSNLRLQFCVTRGVTNYLIGVNDTDGVARCLDVWEDYWVVQKISSRDNPSTSDVTSYTEPPERPSYPSEPRVGAGLDHKTMVEMVLGRGCGCVCGQ